MSNVLIKYKSVQAWMVWILVCFTVYVLLIRYNLVVIPSGDSFLAGVFSRFWGSYLYGVIGMAFLGSLGYSLSLFIVLTSSKYLLRLVALKLSGIPSHTTASDISFIHNGGYELAVSPLHNAAALFPGLGFLGTVIGISLSIDGLSGILSGQDPGKLISGLRTAFDTTFLGLVAALILTLINMLLAQTVAKKRSTINSES